MEFTGPNVARPERKERGYAKSRRVRLGGIWLGPSLREIEIYLDGHAAYAAGAKGARRLGPDKLGRKLINGVGRAAGKNGWMEGEKR